MFPLFVSSSYTTGHGFTLRDINPTGSTSNCLECSIRVDDLLARTRPLSPAGASDVLDFNVLERVFGSKFSDVLSADDLLKNLSATSRGDRGIIFAIPEKIDRFTEGHFFNFANQKDIVRFLDGQTGTAADFAKFFKFRFLRTN